MWHLLWLCLGEAAAPGPAAPFPKQTCPLQGTGQGCAAFVWLCPEGPTKWTGWCSVQWNKGLSEMEIKADTAARHTVPQGSASHTHLAYFVYWVCFRMFVSALRLFTSCACVLWINRFYWPELLGVVCVFCQNCFWVNFDLRVQG